MKSKEYWEGRFIDLQRSQLKRADSFAHELEDLHARMQKEIDDDITVWYKKVATANGISMADAKKLMSRKDRKEFQWTLEEYEQHAKADLLSGVTSANVLNASANWHLSYLDGMKLQLEHHVDKLYKNIDSKTRNHFKESLNENYLNTAFELQKGIGIGEKMEVPYDERKLENILRTPWASDGKNFSQRIWKDRTQLVNNLQKNLSESVIRGDSDTDMIQALSKDEKKAEFNTRRLVETESAFFDSESERQCCEDFGVEKYRFLAVLDMKTSDICQELDNKVFLEKDRQVGVNAPPMHPFCRSTTAPVIDEDFLTSRRAKNPKTGEYDEIPPEMNYKQWKEKYVEGKDNAEEVKQEQVKVESSTGTGSSGAKIELEPQKVNALEGETVYKNTSIPQREEKFDSEAYENRVKKQAEKREDEAYKPIDLQEKQILPKERYKQENNVNFNQQYNFTEWENLKKNTVSYLKNNFDINLMINDLDEDIVKGINKSFTKLNAEIVKIRGNSIKFSALKNIGSTESLYNAYLEEYINYDIEIEAQYEEYITGIRPSKEWKTAKREEKQKELEDSLKNYCQLAEDSETVGITYGKESITWLNPKYFGIYINKQNLKYCNKQLEKDRWCSPYCGNIVGTINHEIGHVLNNSFKVKISEDKRIKDYYEENYKEYEKYIEASPEERKKMPWNFLSGYAFSYHNNEEKKYSEFLAEAISEYLTSPKQPRKIVQNVWDIVTEYIRHYKEE